MHKSTIPTTWDKKPKQCPRCESEMVYTKVISDFYMQTLGKYYTTFRCRCGQMIPLHLYKEMLDTIKSTNNLFTEDLNKPKTIGKVMKQYPEIQPIWYMDFTKFLNVPVIIEDWVDGLHVEITSPGHNKIKLEGKTTIPFAKQNEIMTFINDMPPEFFGVLEDGFRFIGVMLNKFYFDPQLKIIGVMKNNSILDSSFVSDVCDTPIQTHRNFQTVAQLFAAISKEIEYTFLDKGIIIKCEDGTMANVWVKSLRNIVEGMEQEGEPQDVIDEIYAILDEMYNTNKKSFLTPKIAMPKFVEQINLSLFPKPSNIQMYYFNYVLELYTSGELTEPLKRGAK